MLLLPSLHPLPLQRLGKACGCPALLGGCQWLDMAPAEGTITGAVCQLAEGLQCPMYDATHTWKARTGLKLTRREEESCFKPTFSD